MARSRWDAQQDGTVDIPVNRELGFEVQPVDAPTEGIVYTCMRPAAAGTTLTGKGRVLKRGRRVLFAEAEVFDADGKLVAKASGTEIPASP